jgi:hypothetical protein
MNSFFDILPSSLRATAHYYRTRVMSVENIGSLPAADPQLSREIVHLPKGFCLMPGSLHAKEPVMPNNSITPIQIFF